MLVRKCIIAYVPHWSLASYNDRVLLLLGRHQVSQEGVIQMVLGLNTGVSSLCCEVSIWSYILSSIENIFSANGRGFKSTASNAERRMRP